MKKNTFFAATCCLAFGLFMGLGSLQTQAQTFDGLYNGSDAFTVGNHALVHVNGATTNAENARLYVLSTGSINLNGSLTLKNKSVFHLKSISMESTGSLIGYGTTTAEGTGKIRSERYITGSGGTGTANVPDGKWHYFTSPVAGQAINVDWVEINSIAHWDDDHNGVYDNDNKLDFFRWQENGRMWMQFRGNQQNGFEDKFTPGKGYITAVKSDSRAEWLVPGILKFYGKSYNYKTTTVPVSHTPVADFNKECWAGWNLIGNPFPSAYNIKTWLNDNADKLSDCHQAVFMYVEGKSGKPNNNYGNPNYKFCSVSDYVVVSKNSTDFDFEFVWIDETGKVQYETGAFGQHASDYIAVGQGFFVKVKEGITELPFNTRAFTAGSTTDYREHKFDAASAYRGDKASVPSLALLADDGNGNASKTIISFDDRMTFELDPSYDVARLENPEQTVALYSQMIGTKNPCGDMAQQVMPFPNMMRGAAKEDTEAYVIPIGIDVKAQMQNVNFNLLQDQLEDYSIVLEDRKHNSFTKIAENNYATVVEKSESGFGRFYLHFGKLDQDNEEALVAPESLQVSAFVMDANHLKVMNPAFVVGDYQIFDVNGKMLSQGHLTGNGEQVIDIDFAMGLYVLRVNTAIKSQSIKFINK